MPPVHARKCLICRTHAVAKCELAASGGGSLHESASATPHSHAVRCIQHAIRSDHHSVNQDDKAMNRAARQTLRELRSLRNIETYLRTAKAELASDPCDDTLRAFIEIVEALLRDEKAKLVAS